MIKGSKSYLKSTKNKVTKELERFEVAEKEYLELLVTLPAKRQAHINQIVDLTKINVDSLESRLQQVKSLIANTQANYPIILEKVKTDLRLETIYASLDMYELVSKNEEIDKKIVQFQIEDSIKEKKKEKENWLLSLPTITNKISSLESFDSLEDAKENYEDNYDDLFECGEDMYQDEAETFCYVQDRFLHVKLHALTLGHSQDRGGKIFRVEEITKVEFKTFDQDQYVKMVEEQEEREIKNKEAELEALKARKNKTA